MADVENSPQRAAFRSALAQSLSKWGCVGDWNWWDWRYLAPAIEDSLRLSSCRFLGDVYMLACALFEGAVLELLAEYHVESIGEARTSQRETRAQEQRDRLGAHAWHQGSTAAHCQP